MDKFIVKRLRKKDAKAIDYTINKYSQKVYFLVYKIIGNYGKEEIEECVSDVFFKLWNDIEEFDESRGDFNKYIFMKTKYTALDYKRRLEKVKATIDEIDENTANSFSAERVVLSKETSEEIIKIINKFKEPDKAYFYLRYFMYYKIDEIAEKYKVTRASVENRLYRCRVQIKDSIEKGV